jgi:hypothetical protein
MSDPKAARHAAEWLERQLQELAALRNASRRDAGFKAWRQNTLTVLQRIWPGDSKRFDRFRRIPFSPPMTKATDRQTREYYERGWGEAGTFLRELIDEVRKSGVPDPAAAGLLRPAMLLMPEIEPGPPAAGMKAEAEPASGPEPAPAEPLFRADEFFSRSPVFRGFGGSERKSGAKSQPPGPAPGTPAWDLARAADELERLGVPAEDAADLRYALLVLSRAAAVGEPSWEQVVEALRLSGASPALARRIVPLLMEFIERAA